MNLSCLAFEGFRNLVPNRLEFSPGINIFYGNNAQGKTNLLDAIYLLAHLNSFRTTHVTELVEWEKKYLIVEGDVETKRVSHRLKVGMGCGKRRLHVDDMVVKEARDFFVGFRVVIFSPDQVDIIKGSPSTRRKYIDRSAFRRCSDHLGKVKDYNKVLKNRNICLKEGRGDLVDLYGRQLARKGAKVTFSRLEVVHQIETLLSRVYSRVVGVEKEVHVSYSSKWLQKKEASWESWDEDTLEETLYRSVLKTSGVERRRGHTVVGPHTDDITFTIDGVSACRFASQGQIRSLLLALKMTEYQLLYETFGDPPVVLLDDLSSELDFSRRRALLTYLEGIRGQAFVTTTDVSFLDDALPRKEYTVRDGSIREMN